MKIHELLATEARWTKGAYAQDDDCDLVEPNDPRANCWCLMGAIMACYGPKAGESSMHDYTLMDTVIAQIKEKIAMHRPHGFDEIAIWNDAPERTFNDVHALVLELDV